MKLVSTVWVSTSLSKSGYSGVGSKGREHTAKQEGKVRDCSKLTTLFVMELKKNGPRHRQTKGPNKKTTVESFFRGKWGGNITAPWWTI